MLEHIAGHSVAATNGGWNWKFDDKLFDNFELGNIAELVGQLACPLAVIYGAKSALFNPEILAYMTALLRDKYPMIAIPGVHHHLFLEEPGAFIKALERVLMRCSH